MDKWLFLISHLAEMSHIFVYFFIAGAMPMKLPFAFPPKLIKGTVEGKQDSLSPASKASREVANLTEGQNPHTPVYGVKEFVCYQIWPQLLNSTPAWEMGGWQSWPGRGSYSVVWKGPWIKPE